MKKIFVASIFLGLTSMAQATLVQCAPQQGDVVINTVGTSQLFTCGLGGENTVGGGFVTSIRIIVSGTFQQNNPAQPNQLFSVSYSSTNTAGVGIGNVGCLASQVANSVGQAVGACDGTSGFVAVAGAPDTIPQFTVTVTGGPGSNPLPFNASASVLYEVTTQTPGVIPEPATYIMLGSALVGLYTIRRRS